MLAANKGSLQVCVSTCHKEPTTFVLRDIYPCKDFPTPGYAAFPVQGIVGHLYLQLENYDKETSGWM